MSMVFPKRYRITLRVRSGRDIDPVVLELAARTKAAARNAARALHPEHAVVAVEQLSGEDDDATRDLTAIRRRHGAA